MNPGKRKRLGRNVGAMTRETVFETADAIESESREGYDVTRKRVLFEEILLVTIHRELGVLYVTLTAALTVTFAGVAFLSRSVVGVAIFFGILALTFFIACAVRLAARVDFVSVFGRRSKAVMRFSLRKRRAREVYGRICSRALEVQRAMIEPEPEPALPASAPEDVANDAGGAIGSA